MNIEEFCLEEVISDCLDICNTVKDTKDVLFLQRKLQTNRIVSDKIRIKRLLLNILHSSAKYTTNGFVSVDVFDKQHLIKVKIKDTGTDRKFYNQSFNSTKSTLSESYIGSIDFPMVDIAASLELIQWLGPDGKLSIKRKHKGGCSFSFLIFKDLEENERNTSFTKVT